MAQHIDWLHIALGVVTLVWMIAAPILAKKNAKLYAILAAVIQGVEDADHGPTKDAVLNSAVAAGVQDHLDKIVQAETK